MMVGGAPGPTPLVIDCDPGVDDAVAIALAVASPEIELRAVTTVAGNCPVDITTGNALRVLGALGREDIPVAAGATRALVRVGVHHLVSPHGPDGLCGVELPATSRGASAGHAVDLLAGVLRSAGPEPVTVAALGPLTNIALLLALHPDLSRRIGRLVVMGGSLGPGNITPLAEFNIWTDPEAAQRVLGDSELDICLVGLDVTRRATVDQLLLDDLRADSERGALVAELVAAYGEREPDGWPLHDVLAVAAVIDPTVIRTRPCTIEVETGPGPQRGRTVAGAAGPADARPPRLQLAEDLDVTRFRQMVLSAS